LFWDEVKEFQEKYHIPYPIIPDPEFRIHNALGSSKTPYSYYIRKDSNTKSSYIVGTHLGANRNYENLYDELFSMLSVDMSPALSANVTNTTKILDEPYQLDKTKIEMKVRAAFETVGGKLGRFKEIPSQSRGYIYAGELEKGNQKLYAVAANRTVPCDVCHDAQFIYIFDNTGKVLLFEPIQLTKHGNKPWNDDDLSLIRSRILGKYITHPVAYDLQLDAVSSATITSAVIYDDLIDAQKLYERLQEEGLMQ
jgi:hypothetical protein